MYITTKLNKMEHEKHNTSKENKTKLNNKEQNQILLKKKGTKVIPDQIP